MIGKMPFPKSGTSSLTVAGSAAHMHSRDYIEIINVVYKDEFDRCCGKDHSSPDLTVGKEPLLRKRWVMRQENPNSKTGKGYDKEDKNRKPHRIHSSGTTREYAINGKGNNIQRVRTKQQNRLPDIHTAKVQKAYQSELPKKQKSADLGLQEAPHDNFICSCKEGLVYLKKTHEWQNLLGEYRDEILKLRDNLKEREQIGDRRARFKRSSTLEQRKNISELFKEYRSNSYQLLRLRMEERMRHEHKVFEKLSKKTQRLHIFDDSSDYSNKMRPSHQGLSSRSPTPPSSSSTEEEVCPRGNPYQKQRGVSVRISQVPKARDSMIRQSSMKSPSKVFSKRAEQARTPFDTTEVDDQKEAGDVDVSLKRLEGTGNRRPQRVVVRKRVVRCACLNHK